MCSDLQTVLIVDDTPADIMMLANALQEDYRILIATKGQDALRIARSDTPPDLILLDILMPDIDGFQICKKLKANPETMSIPVVFVTSLHSYDDQEKGLNLGAVDYITKPFHFPVFKARLRNHMLLKLKTDQLEQLSHLDGLTGIANRRHFEAVMAREQSRLKRLAGNLSIIMIDIDYFKSYNDHYGHGAGDECLIQVAKTLSSLIKRPTDLLARYGGEEFAVVLPDTDLEGATLVGQSLHAEINRMNFPHEYSDIADNVTVSIGVASSVVGNKSETVEGLLKRADEALFKAKENGRNRVYVAR